MEDKSLLEHIHELVEQEKALRAAHHGLTEEDRQRLEQLEQELDRTWDLLRQRRAHTEFDESPDDAHARSTAEVESYLQ